MEAVLTPLVALYRIHNPADQPGGLASGSFMLDLRPFGHEPILAPGPEALKAWAAIHGFFAVPASGLSVVWFPEAEGYAILGEAWA